MRNGSDGVPLSPHHVEGEDLADELNHNPHGDRPLNDDRQREEAEKRGHAR